MPPAVSPWRRRSRRHRAWSGEAPHIVLPASYLGGQALVGSVMLGMSPRLVALLSANYQVAAVGWGQVAGRVARVVTARRGGRLAARFWLDKATMLPLRLETFDGHGHVVSDATFMALTVGTDAAGAPAGTVPRQWGTGRGPVARRGLAAAGAAAGRAWRCSVRREGNTATGEEQGWGGLRRAVPGLCVPPARPSRSWPPGWSRMALGGSQVYADDSSGQMFAWSARGFVGTSLVAAAPPQPWRRSPRPCRHRQRQPGAARPAAARPAPAGVLADPVIAAHGQGCRDEVAGGAGHRGGRALPGTARSTVKGTRAHAPDARLETPCV